MIAFCSYYNKPVSEVTEAESESCMAFGWCQTCDDFDLRDEPEEG